MINAQSMETQAGVSRHDDSAPAATAADAAAHVSVAEGARGLPVAVELRRWVSRSGRWSLPAWEAVSVVCGEGLGTTAARVQPLSGDGRESGDVPERRFLVGGLRLQLFVDGCESYWYNLQGESPKLFVVCFQEDEADTEEGLGLTPALVTASQDEAGAHMESDDPVFAVPMPALALDWVERFVVAHYVPVIKKKRRRREWQKESQYGQRGPAPVDRERR